MKPAPKFAILAVLLAMSSACVRPAPPRTVSDFCLNDRAITIEVAPEPNADDPGNRWDSDATVDQILEHNAVRDRLCLARPAAN